jgi:hypothetical protein
MDEWMYRSIFPCPCRFTPGEIAPGTHWIGVSVDPRAGLDDVEKRKFLTRPLCRPACSQSLYRLSCPGFSHWWRIKRHSWVGLKMSGSGYNSIKVSLRLLLTLVRQAKQIRPSEMSRGIRCSCCSNQSTSMNVSFYQLEKTGLVQHVERRIRNPLKS